MFNLNIRGTLYPAVAELLERLAQHRQTIAEDLLTNLRRDVAAYRAAEGDELVALQTHCSDHVDAFLVAVRTGRVPRGPSAEFVVRFAERAARTDFQLEVLLRGYRTNSRTLTHWVGEQASSGTRDGMRAALAVIRMVMEYTDSVSSTLAEAYLYESQRLLVESGSLQRDLLEDLLAGRAAAAGGMEARLRAAGLEPSAALQVAVVSSADLVRAAEAVGHQFAMAHVRGLRVVRHEELVVVAPASAPLRQMFIRASEREPLAAGISLPVESLEQMARAHMEARRALALAPAGGVLRLADLSLFDYLLAGADDTAPRLGPAGVEQLRSPLPETLLAYAACDLNVGTTARRMHLHPNTVHYRLRQIERLTGYDVRRLRDVVDLVAAVRLAQRTSA